MEKQEQNPWVDFSSDVYTNPGPSRRERRATEVARPVRLRPKTETINTVRKESKQTLPCILSMDPVVAMRQACGQPFRHTLFAHIESLVAYYHEKHINEVLVFMLSIGEDVITPIHAAYLESILNSEEEVEELEDLTQFVEEL